MKIYLLIFLISMCVISCKYVNQSDIPKPKEVTSQEINFDSVMMIEKIFDNLELSEILQKQFSKENLIELTSHKLPDLRRFAYLKLSEDDDFYTSTWFNKLLKDSALVKVYQTCQPPSLGELRNDVFQKIRIQNFENEKRKEIIQDFAIFESNHLGWIYTVLESLEVKERYYDRIREVAISTELFFTVYYLSKFKKEEDLNFFRGLTKNKDFIYANKFDAQYQKEKDLPLLSSFLKKVRGTYYCWEICEIFPHSSFYPILQKDLEDFREKEFEDFNGRFLHALFLNYPGDVEDIYRELIKSKSVDAHIALWAYLSYGKPNNYTPFVIEIQEMYKNKTLHELLNERSDEKLRLRLEKEENERQAQYARIRAKK